MNPLNNPQHKEGEVAKRQNGVLISMIKGKTLAYGLHPLQERGRLFFGAGVEVYEGQVVGIHSRNNDLVVNPTKAKQLTIFIKAMIKIKLSICFIVIF